MTDEIDRAIEDAAAALRAETSGPSSELDAARTRAKILATQRRSRVAATTPMWLAAAALLVCFGGSIAWAYWAGRIGARVSEPAAPPITGASSTTLAPGPIETTPAPTVVAIAPPSSVAVAPDPGDAPEMPLPSVVDTRERAAYRTAHALHFEAHDPEGALAAWDAYLARYPSGRFALEARYNRALCLVRLGRTSEARAALAPFVAGIHGGYRQQEATALAAALDE
jgi:hypothetical protein